MIRCLSVEIKEATEFRTALPIYNYGEMSTSILATPWQHPEQRVGKAQYLATKSYNHILPKYQILVI